MKTHIKQLVTILGLAATTVIHSQASISDFYGLGNTWAGTPSFQTVAAPTFAAAEGNFGGTGNNGLGQTFSLSSAGTLSSIQIGMAGAPGTTYGVALYDLGPVSGNPLLPPATSASTTVGANLLSTGFATTSFTLGAFTGSQVANFAFTGADAISLSAGEYYMFVLMTGTASTSTSALQWTRGGGAGASFTGGQFFRANSGSTGFGAINGAIRQGDFALTATAAPEPSSMALAGLAAASMVIFRRRKQ